MWVWSGSTPSTVIGDVYSRKHADYKPLLQQTVFKWVQTCQQVDRTLDTNIVCGLSRCCAHSCTGMVSQGKGTFLYEMCNELKAKALVVYDCV